MKQLIINADDFGMSREVNDGTKQGIKAGIVTSVSVMVNMPYFEDAVVFLKRYPHISVGLHFNITEGKSILPPTEVESLLREDDSFFHWTHLVFTRLNLSRFEPLEAKKELEAQIKVLERTGIPITHIDSHHHIHLHPRLFPIVSGYTKEKKINSVRCHHFDLWNLHLGIRKKPILTQTIVSSLLLLNNMMNDHDNHQYTIDRFFDLNWAYTIKPKEFLHVLQNLPDGTTEFICHLATVSKKGNKRFLVPRHAILRLLQDQGIEKYLKSKKITLVPHH